MHRPKTLEKIKAKEEAKKSIVKTEKRGGNRFPTAPPTKCTPENIETICKAVRMGCYPAIASQAAGIEPRSFYTWLKRGMSGEEPYKTFYDAVNVAQAEAENHLVNTIKVASEKNWIPAAWLLERTHPDRYSIKTKQELSGPDGGPMQIAEVQVTLQGKLDRLAAVVDVQAEEVK